MSIYWYRVLSTFQFELVAEFIMLTLKMPREHIHVVALSGVFYLS